MSTSTRRVAVIMAGGSGERFWPLSRTTKPKQLLKLTNKDQTLLEEAVHRIAPLVDPTNIFISTTMILRDAICAAGLPVPPENILAEPLKRNTAGCLCWVAAELMARFPGESVTIAVLTADHLILQPELFRSRVAAAMAAAEDTGALVTLGVVPDRPETGYGYVEVHNGQNGAEGALRVERFREKPNLSLAEDFVASGRHYWNSGMFFWTNESFLRELESASPIHATITRAMVAPLTASNRDAATSEFAKLPDISIDYALLEKSSNVRMIRADFPWDDVGSWDALGRSRTPDADNNIVEGGAILKDTHDCIVINEAGEENIAVGIIGVENLVVIISKDAVLIVPKDKAQEVRHIPRELKKRNATQT